MSVKEIDCDFVEQHDLVAAYLAGELPQVEAEAFGAHYLSCDRCWAEVRQGNEIRAALAKPVITPVVTEANAPPATRHNAWTLLAAAAAVAVIGAGIWQLALRPRVAPSEPIYRGASSDTLLLQIAADGAGQIRLSWPALNNARTYVVRVFASDGVSVWRRETPETSISFDSNEPRRNRPGVSFLAKVEALDTMGRVLAKSALKPLPSP